jgi:hypothetical protein
MGKYSKYLAHIGKIIDIDNTHNPEADIIAEQHAASVVIPGYGDVIVQMDGMDAVMHGYDNFDEFLNKDIVVKITPGGAVFCGVVGSGAEVNDIEEILN